MNAKRQPLPLSPRFDSVDDASFSGLLKTGLHHSKLRMTCPRCRQQVEILDEELGETTCPACRRRFYIGSHREVDLLYEPIKRVGRFELMQFLGSGGFGVVWKAYDPNLKRPVALKLPKRLDFLVPGNEKYFLREAQIVSKLNHPNIVPVFETGTFEGTPYIVSELVESPTLADYLRGHGKDIGRYTRWITTLAEAVHYAHERGVVHRDLKPSNVMLQETRDRLTGQTTRMLRLMDFGFAFRDQGEGSLTLDRSVLGTPVYMSPEQIANPDAVGPRSDVYALGVMLYEMLTGSRPFKANSVQAMAQCIVTGSIIAPRKLDKKIPVDLETIILKCLEKEPARRYATAQMLADDLRRFCEGKPIVARPLTCGARVMRWCRRESLVATLVLLLTVSCAAGGVFFSKWRDAESEREVQTRSASIVDSNFIRAHRFYDALFPDASEERFFEPWSNARFSEKFLNEALRHHRLLVEELPLHNPLVRLRALYRIALITEQLGEFENAVSAYQAAIEWDDVKAQWPRYRVECHRIKTAAHVRLAQVYKNQGRDDEALFHFSQAESFLNAQVDFPESEVQQANVFQLQCRLGEMKKAIGQYRHALEHFQNALAIEPYGDAAVQLLENIVTLAQYLGEVEVAQHYFSQENERRRDKLLELSERERSLQRQEMQWRHFQFAKFLEAREQWPDALHVIENGLAIRWTRGESMYRDDRKWQRLGQFNYLAAKLTQRLGRDVQCIQYFQTSLAHYRTWAQREQSVDALQRYREIHSEYALLIERLNSERVYEWSGAADNTHASR